MDIILPNHVLREAAEKADKKAQAIAEGSTPLIRGKAENGLEMLIKPEYLKGEMTPKEKITLDKFNQVLTEKTQMRDTTCWTEGCTHAPSVWVREIQYDVAKPGTALMNAHVSTADYEGSVPGFCALHLISGSEYLVKIVYLNRPEIQWGYYPERAVIIYSDGMKTEFEAKRFVVSHQITSEDIHTKGVMPHREREPDGQ